MSHKVMATFADRSIRIRRNLLASIFCAESGHPGGSLSCVEIINYLFCERYAEQKISEPLILSKGHAVPTLYASACEVNLLNYSQLSGLRKIDNILQGHPSVLSTPWVTTSTGSLGQGISAGCGLALGYKYSKLDNFVNVVVGDGELQEGQVWEALMFASITAFII